MSRLRILLLAAVLGAAVGVAYAQVGPGGVNGVRGSGNAGYPPGATPVAAAGAGATSAGATLGAAPGKFTYVCGFQVSTLEGITANNIAATVAPLNSVGSVTFTYQLQFPASTATTFSQIYNPCIPANAINTGISVAAPANADASAVDVSIWGYMQ